MAAHNGPGREMSAHALRFFHMTSFCTLLLVLFCGSPSHADQSVQAFNKAVFNKIAGQPRRHIRHQGATLVFFEIATDGSLISSRVAKPSGSQVLDDAALLMVQSAAPFPRPPVGAKRQFTVTINGIRNIWENW
ncbi:MAG: energy transducer TonB [Pseudomonadota bacterium]